MGVHGVELLNYQHLPQVYSRQRVLEYYHCRILRDFGSLERRCSLHESWTQVDFLYWILLCVCRWCVPNFLGEIRFEHCSCGRFCAACQVWSFSNYVYLSDRHSLAFPDNPLRNSFRNLQPVWPLHARSRTLYRGIKNPSSYGDLHRFRSARAFLISIHPQASRMTNLHLSNYQNQKFNYASLLTLPNILRTFYQPHTLRRRHLRSYRFLKLNEVIVILMFNHTSLQLCLFGHFDTTFLLFYQ